MELLMQLVCMKAKAWRPFRIENILAWQPAEGKSSLLYFENLFNELNMSYAVLLPIGVNIVLSIKEDLKTRSKVLFSLNTLTFIKKSI